MIKNVASEELSRRLRRRGALILAVAGLVWVSFGTSGLTVTATGRVLVPVVAVLVTLAAIALAVRSSSRPAPRRQLPVDWLQRVGLVNLIQLAAIAVAVPALIATGHSALVPAVVCLIVGLHFLPLARLFGQWQYRWTGILLCLAAVAGITVYLGGLGRDQSSHVVGIGAAVILWGTSIHVALSGPSIADARCEAKRRSLGTTPDVGHGSPEGCPGT